MKFSAAVLALAAGASAALYPVGTNGTTYVTEVVSSYETYCAGPTTITHADKTYTVTKATTLTITNCPCTISKPVYTSSVVNCKTCSSSKPTSYPTGHGSNSTTAAPTYSVKPTGSATLASSSTKAPSTIPTAGAGKAVALTGAGLAGALGFVAALL